MLREGTNPNLRLARKGTSVNGDFTARDVGRDPFLDRKFGIVKVRDCPLHRLPVRTTFVFAAGQLYAKGRFWRGTHLA